MLQYILQFCCTSGNTELLKTAHAIMVPISTKNNEINTCLALLASKGNRNKVAAV